MAGVVMGAYLVLTGSSTLPSWMRTERRRLVGASLAVASLLLVVEVVLLRGVLVLDWDVLVG